MNQSVNHLINHLINELTYFADRTKMETSKAERVKGLTAEKEELIAKFQEEKVSYRRLTFILVWLSVCLSVSHSFCIFFCINIALSHPSPADDLLLSLFTSIDQFPDQILLLAVSESYFLRFDQPNPIDSLQSSFYSSFYLMSYLLSIDFPGGA